VPVLGQARDIETWRRGEGMADVVFVLLGLGFFAACVALAGLFERLLRG